jgi:hypothetical protein
MWVGAGISNSFDLLDLRQFGVRAHRFGKIDVHGAVGVGVDARTSISLDFIGFAAFRDAIWRSCTPIRAA